MKDSNRHITRKNNRLPSQKTHQHNLPEDTTSHIETLCELVDNLREEVKILAERVELMETNGYRASIYDEEKDIDIGDTNVPLDRMFSRNNNQWYFRMGDDKGLADLDDQRFYPENY